MTEAELTARLVKVNAAIDWKLDSNVDSRTIAGRTLVTMSLSELEELRRGYERELAEVQAGQSPRVVGIRFGRPA